MNDLQRAAVAMTGLHDGAWRSLRTMAHLAAWVEARQRGLDVATCDAVADAAIDGMMDLMRTWAAEVD